MTRFIRHPFWTRDEASLCQKQQVTSIKWHKDCTMFCHAALSRILIPCHRSFHRSENQLPICCFFTRQNLLITHSHPRKSIKSRLFQTYKKMLIKTSWWFQNGNLPQVGVKIKNVRNHHLQNILPFPTYPNLSQKTVPTQNFSRFPTLILASLDAAPPETSPSRLLCITGGVFLFSRI